MASLPSRISSDTTYKGLIKELADDLNLQKLLLSNTCEQLLTGVVESDDELVRKGVLDAELLDNPTPSSWKREALVSALKKRLQHSFGIFVGLVSRLTATLVSLTNRIGLDSDGQPRWVDAKSRKQYWKRFSNCLFRKEHEALLARMARDNQNIKHLVQDSLQLEPLRSKTRKRRTEVKHHERKGLVTQIDSQLNPVQASMLRHLDEQHRNLNGQNVATRPAKMTTSKSNLSASLQRLRHLEKKRVAWTVVPGIQVASVQLTDSTNSPSSDEPRIIDDLCHSLRSTNECEEKSCVGRLENEQSSYSIYAVSRCAYQAVDATNLYELLSQNQGPSTAISNRLTRKIRLQLAVILASTALQLHTTPWLDSSWNGKIISFHQGALNHPYISKVFTKATPTQSIEKPTLGPVRNQTLFALGILLLELSTGKPLDSFKDPQNSGPFEEFVTASQVLQAISEEESPNYYGAAEACIYCNFRGSAKDLNLGNDAFRQAFYEDVVVPLEEDLKYYCRA
ncbi:MAG: hypothetical protein LQ337_004977 [Flavoplaca oasis]|nr:MAG: hypothetical protein LQ337_004977 [Flavoplaca oasis]